LLPQPHHLTPLLGDEGAFFWDFMVNERVLEVEERTLLESLVFMMVVERSIV
jgi:hypothetical protein